MDAGTKAQHDCSICHYQHFVKNPNNLNAPLLCRNQQVAPYFFITRANSFLLQYFL